jgi:hypothetical protein
LFPNYNLNYIVLVEKSGPLDPDFFFSGAISFRMSIGHVVRHFEGIGKVPVDIKDVLALVREICPDEVIKVRGVDVDNKKIRGNCYRYKIADGAILVPRPVSLVVYSTRDDEYCQRLVCCKELIHIVDPDPIVTSKKEEVIHLAERVTKPVKFGASGLNPNDLQVFLDQLAKWEALAVLFPFGLWEEVMPKYKKGKVDLETISDWVEIPVEFVNTIMTDAWEKLRTGLIGA